jgi:hypothetical protein
VAVAAFANGLAGAFQFDDWNVIVNDPRVQTLGAWARSMPGIRPVLKLSYAANHASGLGLAGFHAVNVLVHAVNAALVLLLLRALARRGSPEAPLDDAVPDDAVPLCGALLFALHPVQTEAVTYVSGRSASLAALFILASALVWLAGRDGGRRWSSVASPLLFALALGTREQALALPFVLVALDAADLRRPFSLRAALRATAGHWLVLAAAAGAVVASPTYRRMIGESLALRGAGANVATHLGGLAWLAGQVVRPDRLDADPLLPVRVGLDAGSALAAVVLLAALVAGVALLRRRPAAALALLWTVLWLPLAGWWVPRAEPANDRHLYLALIGPAWLLARGLGARQHPRWRRAAAGLLLAALFAGTVARNRVYADEVTFWAAVTRTSPGSARAFNNLGFALAARCRLDEAEGALQRAVALEPEGFRAKLNLRLLREGEPLGPGGARCSHPR